MDLIPAICTMGHEDRLEHVIGHLIQNGLDATSGEGRVTVRLRREDDAVVIEVADCGVGMSQEFVRHQLFKPFQTTKNTGMGIGVYESSQYVTELGGRLLVDSKPNAGTLVRVFLPLAGEAVSASVEPTEAA
jgi:signal transduction histidine kinase